MGFGVAEPRMSDVIDSAPAQGFASNEDFC
jgi:hypothetical protein